MSVNERPWHEYALVIGEQHIDLFGHVNNAAYLAMLEEARWDLITRNGYGRPVVRERGLGPTILEVTVRFKKELLIGERIVIRTRTASYKGKIGRLEQIMVREGGDVACAAEFVFALFDLNARKLVRPTPEWRRAVGLPETGDSA